MVPSNTLSATDASKLALKVLEMPIVRDYLAETNLLAPQLAASLVPGEQDWWDTVSKHSYAMVLSKRHGKPTYDTVMAKGNLKWPDLSTFNAPTVLRFAFGDAVRAPPIQGLKPGKGRSEVYEIKPDNKNGLKDAQKKLNDVDESYRDFALSGTYRRGYVYPRWTVGTKTIQLQSRFIDVYRYLVNLYLKPLRVGVHAVFIELRRPEPGVVLYKICVELDGADGFSRESAWVIANFAVRILSEVNTAAHPAKLRKAVTKLIETLEPVEPLGKAPPEMPWVIMGRDYRTVPFLRFRRAGPIADEIVPRLDGIRDAMYSRLMGAPGDLYFICADKTWMELNVELPRVLQMRMQTMMLGTQDASRTAAARTLAGVTSALGVTVGEVLKAAPQVPLILSSRVAQWMYDHPGATLVIVTVTIVVTAALILSAGTAAPVVVPAGEATIGLAVGTEATVGTAMLEPVMAVVAPETAAVSAVPVATSAESASVTAPTLVNLARQLATTGVSTGELSAARAAATADEILIKALTHPAVLNGARTALKAAVPLASVSLIGLSPSRAYAHTGQATANVSAAMMQDEHSIELPMGQLKLIRTLKPQQHATPELYKPFDGDAFVDRGAEAFVLNPPRIGEMYMLGAIEIL